MEFELQVRNALQKLQETHGLSLAVDSTRQFQDEDDTVVMVSYHFDGPSAVNARFSFPFVQSVPLEESLAALLDFGQRSWGSAQFAPLPYENKLSARA